MGQKARTVLAKTAGLSWLISAGLIVWHIYDGRDPDGTLIALFLVLATSGTLIAAIRHDSGGGDQAGVIIDRLVDAFIASRPDGGAPGLRLVDPEETQSQIPAPRRSAL